MIVKYPTGLYRNILPKKPEDSGNVTFTISNNTPPRSDLLFPKIPRGIVEKRKTYNQIDLVERRNSFGSLAFTVSKATRKEEGNNARQFEIGQVLDFNDTSGKQAEVMLVRSVTEIRHDTNILDYEQMGLTEEESTAIAELSLLTQNQLMDRLNELKQLRGDAEQVINVQQKLINDTTKTINSLQVTLDEGPTSGSVMTEISIVEQLISKLEAKRNVAFETRDKAIQDANLYAQEATKVLDQLRTVGTLVK